MSLFLYPLFSAMIVVALLNMQIQLSPLENDAMMCGWFIAWTLIAILKEVKKLADKP